MVVDKPNSNVTTQTFITQCGYCFGKEMLLPLLQPPPFFYFAHKIQVFRLLTLECREALALP